MLATSGFSRKLCISEQRYRFFSFPGARENSYLFSKTKVPSTPLYRGSAKLVKAYARNSKKVKNKRKDKNSTLLEISRPSENSDKFLDDNLRRDGGLDSAEASLNEYEPSNSATRPSRRTVLQACVITSGLLLALGAVIRQASNVASTGRWAFLDSYTAVSFSFEMWHIELIIGMVILISLCRFILLNTWQDFSESSEAANQQVLSSLQPLDYVVVAFLPGISEELLFRGAFLPVFGLNWISALTTAAVFGILHLGSGRKYSFAIWATFVGFAYGLATIASSSVIVPMAAHSLNNLVGGILWRYTSTTRQDK